MEEVDWVEPDVDVKDEDAFGGTKGAAVADAPWPDSASGGTPCKGSS